LGRVYSRPHHRSAEPRVASQLGRWVGKARRTANQLRFQLEREIAMADIEKAARGERESKPNQADDSAEAPQPSATDAGESAGEGDGAAAEADVPTEAKNDEPKS
jgi:Sec-independent protein translocase protein TatA